MNLICPECKNDVALSRYPQLAVDQAIECDVCGITLLVTGMRGEEALAIHVKMRQQAMQGALPAASQSSQAGPSTGTMGTTGAGASTSGDSNR